MRRLALAVVLAAAAALPLSSAAAMPYPSGGRVVGLQVTTAAPDFDGDGFGDLAVGAPFEDVGSAPDAGSVNVLYGSASGLGSDGLTISQGARGVGGASEPGDFFGADLVAGEFNGDGFSDLAVGAPGEDLGGAVDAGAVTILLGSGAGLAGASRLLTQGNPEDGDLFGVSLETGQFGAGAGGGFDLAVGAPGETVGGAEGAGAVSVIGNPASGPSEGLLFQGAGSVPGVPEAGDIFGWALSANDFNDADGADSLAIGVPGEDVGGAIDAGVVAVRYASVPGPVGLRQLVQNRPEEGDLFGSALADGFLADPSDGSVELAVGAPGETVGGRAGAGAVSVVQAGPTGFQDGGQLLTQGAGVVPGAAETGDRFGAALAVGGFGGGGGDLAIGAPDENLGATADAGVVAVLLGAGGVVGGAGSQQLTQEDGAGAVEPGDRFGEALSDPFLLGSDAFEDLGIGAPGETVAGRPGAGAVSALSGAATGGLGGGGAQFFYQGLGGVGGAAELGDGFAAALS